MKFKLLCEPNENRILFKQTKEKISFLYIMGTEGLEPSRTITRQRILSPSCLPIPPRPLIYCIYIYILLSYPEMNNTFAKYIYRRHPDSN